MKKQNYIILIITSFLFLLGSCTEDPKILEFNESYTPKAPKKGERDKAPPLDLLTVYSYFKTTESNVIITRIAENDGSITINDIEDIILQVKTSIAVEKSTEINIEVMTQEDEEYQKIIKGSTALLPDDTYTILNNTLTFDIGKKEAGETTIRLDAEKFKDLDAKYNFALPLKMTISSGEATIKNHFVLHVSLSDVEALPNGNNVSVATSTPAGTTISGSSLTLYSDYATSSLYKLNDGSSYSYNWWVPSGEDHYLAIGLTETMMVKSVIFDLSYWGGKRLKSVKVLVSNNSGSTYVEQGIAEFSSGSNKAIVVFDTPVNINFIKFKDFIGYDSYIDLYEVKVITSNE